MDCGSLILDAPQIAAIEKAVLDMQVCLCESVCCLYVCCVCACICVDEVFIAYFVLVNVVYFPY